MPGARRRWARHVQCGTGQVAAPQRIIQRDLVHERVTGRIDEPAAGSHPGQAAPVEEPPVVRGRACVERDHIRSLQQVVQTDGLAASRPDGRRIDEGVGRQDAHLECRCPARHA